MKLEITIRGAQGTGKTIIANWIAAMLRVRGHTVTFEGPNEDRRQSAVAAAAQMDLVTDRIVTIKTRLR